MIEMGFGFPFLLVVLVGVLLVDVLGGLIGGKR